MYRHILVPIDCSAEARHEALALARYVGPMYSTKVTIAAAVTPSPAPEIHSAKIRHAEAALSAIAGLLHGYGIHVRRRIVEGKDAACALVAEEGDFEEKYDLIVLGTHQTRPEDDEYPCRGSLADRIARRTALPVMILPGRRVADVGDALGVGA